MFSPSTGNYCARRNSIINNCQTVSCGNITEPKYIQIKYGFNKQYYALCARDQNPDIITPIVYVFVCPTNSVPNINTMPAKCSYNCWKTGFFQNTLDNSKYFECYLNNYLRFESVERRCPNGSYFEPNRSECVVKLRSFSEVSKNWMWKKYLITLSIMYMIYGKVSILCIPKNGVKKRVSNFVMILIKILDFVSKFF